MSIDISRAVRDGISRTASGRGAALVALFVLIGIVGNVGFDSATQAMLQLAEELGEEPPTPVPEDATPFALPLPGTAILLVVVLWLFGWAAAGVVAMRVLVADPNERLRIARLSIATVNELIARVIVWVLIGIGLLLLLIPGIFLAISFYFVRPLIAVEDRNFIDAMIESWELSTGRRFDIFILLLVAGVMYVLILLPGVIAAAAAPEAPLAASIASVLFSAIGTVFWLAVIARTYVQVLDTELDDGVVDDGEPESDDRPEDFDEWDDPPGVDW